MKRATAAKPRAVRLPPDPDQQNNDRASWAQAALLRFQGETNTEDGDAICDLLADLMHLCDREPRYGHFSAQLERARDHYREETNREGKQ